MAKGTKTLNSALQVDEPRTRSIKQGNCSPESASSTESTIFPINSRAVNNSVSRSLGRSLCNRFSSLPTSQRAISTPQIPMLFLILFEIFI